MWRTLFLAVLQIFRSSSYLGSKRDLSEVIEFKQGTVKSSERCTCSENMKLSNLCALCPQDIFSKEHLRILVGRKEICKPNFNIIHLVKMCNYLFIDEGDDFEVIDIKCHQCQGMSRKCSYNYYDETVMTIIMVLFQFCSLVHYIAK